MHRELIPDSAPLLSSHFKITSRDLKLVHVILQVCSACKQGINNQINSLSQMNSVSVHLCQKQPGPPIPELAARCRRTIAWLAMLQAWLGNSLSPSVWMKTGAGDSRHVGLNSYSTHMRSGRQEHVDCVSKCAWIPISCVWEDGLFFSSLSHLGPSILSDFRGNNPSLPSTSGSWPEAWELSLFPHSSGQVSQMMLLRSAGAKHLTWGITRTRPRTHGTGTSEGKQKHSHWTGQIPPGKFKPSQKKPLPGTVCREAGSSQVSTIERIHNNLTTRGVRLRP